jgi:outer membrane protein insertion porin family
MRRILLLFFILIGSFAFSQNEPISIGGLDFSYKSPQEYEIGPIRIVGADNFDHQGIKLIAGLRQGQKITLPSDQITKAIRKLWEEGLFSNVSIYAEKEISGIVYLVIELVPRPKLSRFKFIGVNKREADKVREEISLFSGKTITENLVFQTKSKIMGYFREKGHFGIQVGINRVKDTLMNNAEIFIITIEKGKKIGIEELIISGNDNVPTWK